MLIVLPTSDSIVSSLNFLGNRAQKKWVVGILGEQGALPAVKKNERATPKAYNIA